MTQGLYLGEMIHFMINKILYIAARKQNTEGVWGAK